MTPNFFLPLTKNSDVGLCCCTAPRGAVLLHCPLWGCATALPPVGLCYCTATCGAVLLTAVVDLRFAELDPHADVFWQNIPIWPALKKKLRIWPYQCCSDMIKIHNTRHYAWHNSNLIVQLKEFICTECRCTTAHCTLLTVTV